MTNLANSEYRDRIGRALAYLDEHLCDDINLEELAHQACFSPYHFHRIFTAIIGQPVMAYVRRLRLEKAAGLLTFHRSKSITEIALETGFANSASFAKAFKEHFGCSASQWRKYNSKSKIGQSDSKNGQPDGKDGKVSASPQIYGDHIRSGTGAPINQTRGEAKMEVEIKNLDPIRVAYIRHHGSYDQGMEKIHARLNKWAEARGLIDPQTLYIGMGLDDPDVTPPESLRYDACVSVPSGTMASGEVKIKTLEGGRHAVVHYEGPRLGIAGVYGFLCGQWLPTSGFEPEDRPAYQLYYGSEEDVKNDKHIFDLCLSVRPL